MKVCILFVLIAVVFAFEISDNCPANKTLGYFGDCPESCLSLVVPPAFCTLKLNYGCMCKEGYVLLQDNEFSSDCIKPEDCPAAYDCEKAPDSGMCRGYFPRYYYDPEASQCKEFIYGGCGGNLNNFKTEDECKNRCGA
ncbi:four-domain proteases inhibitor-like [Argiope bruennichi]|uniref:four-domain proteases inhibitor-like n=1 Tax=Argiope bruennichi TaxID=94029 RepID=UPI002495A3DA|nr:four-domain proteases inhibitor-like [Argiope bruennichi]